MLISPVAASWGSKCVSTGPEVTDPDAMVFFHGGTTRNKLARNVLSIQHKFNFYKADEKGG